MGRPINKRYFGVTGGDGATVFTPTGPNIPIRFKTGGVVYEGYILKQVGSRRFKCSTDDGTTAVAICVTVDAGASFDPANNGECVLLGFQATSGTPRIIRRMTNRIAWDFLGRMHKWSLQDDSTETLIVLTQP
jgi:hypothetical protein